MTAQYNFLNIRTLLTEGFSEAELRSFCFYYPEFRDVYHQLSENSGKSQVVDWLIDHADRRELFGSLLTWAKEQNPVRYKRHQPYTIFSDALGTSERTRSSSIVRQDYPSSQLAVKDPADLDNIRSLLDIKQRRLNVLIEQKAAMGPHTPAHITMEIDNLQTEIKQHQIELGIAPLPDETAAESSPNQSTLNSEIQLDKEIFVSYAWGGESEKIVDQLDRAFQNSGITIIRDKRDLGYRGHIKEFMEKIGRGNAIIVVISKKYLESENCMFELVQIAKNDQFYDRIFPIVLGDANIYKPVQRLRYVKYWEEQIAELDQEMKSVSSANLQGFREAIDLYTEIRGMIAKLTDTLTDMNALTVEMHREADFKHLIDAIEQKMAE